MTALTSHTSCVLEDECILPRLLLISTSLGNRVAGSEGARKIAALMYAKAAKNPKKAVTAMNTDQLFALNEIIHGRFGAIET